MDSVLVSDEPTPTEEIPRFQDMRKLYPDWHEQAQCVGQSDSVFFGAGDPDVRPPYTLSDIKRAKNICAECPVIAECLRSALTNREEYGVWAGTTRKQRKRLLDEIDAGDACIDEVVERMYP